MKEQKKLSLVFKIKTLLIIAILIISTYSILTFICHFSVNNSSENYSILESFKAISGGTTFPYEFLIGFFGIGVLIVLLAVSINFILNKTIVKKK